MLNNLATPPFTSLPQASLLLSIAGSILAYLLLLRPIYNVFVHPLRKYPGPKLFATSGLPVGFWYMTGKWHNKLRQLHESYGPVIRIGPDELSYAHPDAWDDIYGRYVPAKRKENGKPEWYVSPDAHDMVGATLGDHGRMRRVMAPGFTYGAMCKQEPLIKVHVDLFLQRLEEKSKMNGGVIDMLEWLTYCTFDLIGDLAFGEPFGCLTDSMLHPFLQLVFANIYVTHMLMLCKRNALFYLFLPLKTTYQMYKDFNTHVVVLKEVVKKRLSLGTQRHDFVDIMTAEQAGKSLYMTHEEIFKNAILLTGGGAETTSSSLTGMCYILSTRPDIKEKVVKELHTVFPTEDDINMRSVADLTYTGAFIEEAMRFYPPGPNAMWRQTPPEGNTILGETIPGNTVLGIPHRVLYRSSRWWQKPDEFHPERWLPEGQRPKEFDQDRRDGFHPFSYGPRQCIATNLAYAEMRYILARLLWNFDLAITETSLNWMDNQKAYLVWDKPGLWLRVRKSVSK